MQIDFDAQIEELNNAVNDIDSKRKNAQKKMDSFIQEIKAKVEIIRQLHAEEEDRRQAYHHAVQIGDLDQRDNSAKALKSARDEKFSEIEKLRKYKTKMDKLLDDYPQPGQEIHNIRKHFEQIEKAIKGLNHQASLIFQQWPNRNRIAREKERIDKFCEKFQPDPTVFHRSRSG